MKIKLLAIAAVTLLSGCSSLTDLLPMTTIRQATGGGNEPGWQIKVNQTHSDQYTFKLDNNYGDDHYRGTLKLHETHSTQYHFVGRSETGKIVTVQLQKAPCVDDADQKFSHQITVVIRGDSALSGCASINNP